MDLNNNLVNINLKVKCDLCQRSFFGDFLSKHMRVSHPGVERPKKKKSWEIKLQPSENDNVKCLDCQNIFSTMESAKIHYKTQHFAVKTNKNCKCQLCAKYFENNKKLKKHILKKHNSNGWMIKDVGPYKKLFNKCVFPSLKSNGSSNSTFQNRTKKRFKEENQLQVIDRVNVEFNNEKHEAIDGEHGISTKNQATKLPAENIEWKQLKQNQDGRIYA